MNLWHAAVLEVRNLLEQTDSALKNERLEAFTSLLGTLKEVVTAQCFKPDVILVSKQIYYVVHFIHLYYFYSSHKVHQVSTSLLMNL